MVRFGAIPAFPNYSQRVQACICTKKKELKVLSIPTHSITPEASVLLKIEIRNSVLLEIAGNTHSPFCPYLADYSACVPPALQKDSISDFIVGKN